MRRTFRRGQNAFAKRFRLLFFFLLTYLIVYPYTQKYHLLQDVAVRAFGIAVTVLSVYAVSFRRSFLLFALILAAPTLVHRFSLAGTHHLALLVPSTILSLAFDGFIVIVIFRRVFGKPHLTSETIYGALCIYLLVAFSFGNLYQLLSELQPGAFYLDPKLNTRAVPDRFDFLYYSFGTICTMGTSGITPISDQARSLSVIEAILGVLYVAVLIAGLLGSQRQPKQE